MIDSRHRELTSRWPYTARVTVFVSHHHSSFYYIYAPLFSPFYISPPLYFLNLPLFPFLSFPNLINIFLPFPFASRRMLRLNIDHAGSDDILNSKIKDLFEETKEKLILNFQHTYSSEFWNLQTWLVDMAKLDILVDFRTWKRSGEDRNFFIIK